MRSSVASKSTRRQSSKSAQNRSGLKVDVLKRGMADTVIRFSCLSRERGGSGKSFQPDWSVTYHIAWKAAQRSNHTKSGSHNENGGTSIQEKGNGTRCFTLVEVTVALYGLAVCVKCSLTRLLC